ncbi:MAG: hypothetical protein D5R96_06990 [Methanocalculus sp. MSAO_Arc2]|uniref:hypothetical protein n=1 Tax=Methanocalculus sp. MSAO_Arc2 TaxID=2293855 RepID=UPI000FF27C5D|nr:MAG: hypothetical protein D5R96_06990 [Methanocalculus sp. MSAO_Arc2]
MALLYLLFIFYLSFWLTVALLILGAVYGHPYQAVALHPCIQKQLNINAALTEKSVAYQEFISGIKTIFITGFHPFWADRYDAAVRKP